MPRLPLRAGGPLGLALTTYDLWRRLTPRQKRMLAEGARTYGPLLATRAARSARAAATSLRSRVTPGAQ